jgi:hypothetical protein
LTSEILHIEPHQWAALLDLATHAQSRNARRIRRSSRRRYPSTAACWLSEDRGGNSIDVRFNGRKENLHSLWDTALVELDQGTPAEIAVRIQAAVTGDDRQQWQQGTPADWALESLAIVRAQVYRIPASGEITATYIEAARAVIRTRLAQAGARLAFLA